MSIVVKAEHINLIVYKYLQEMGYNHTAFLFEKEANIKILNDKLLKVPVNFLPTICEQSLILRSLEIHADLLDSQECTEELDLLSEHHCTVSKRRLDERRRKLQEVNERVAVQLKEDLRIQAEAKKREQEEAKRREEERRRAAEIETLATNIIPEEKTDSRDGLEEEEEDENQLDGEEAEESLPVVTNGAITEEDLEEDNEEFVVDGEEEVHIQTRVGDFEITDLDLPANLKVFDQYYNGFNNFLLLKDVSGEGGAVKGYIVNEVTKKGSRPTLNTLFILPASFISSSADSEVKVSLKKHLVLQRSNGVLHFINFERREVHGTLDIFKQQKILSVEHDYNNACYIITTKKAIHLIDDFTLGPKVKFEGKYKKCQIRQDGLILLLGQDNSIIKRKIGDPDFKEVIRITEGTPEKIQFSSNGLYFGALIKNPYHLKIWLIDQNEHLFTFNENNKFEHFVIDGDSEEINSYAVCFDEEYAKLWDCDLGCFINSFDFSRKTLKEALTVKNGEILILSQERNNCVKAINMKTKKETELVKGDDEEVKVYKLNSGMVCTFSESKLRIITFD